MSQFHSLTVKQVRTETRDAVSILFDVPATLSQQFRFTQGQYLVMRTQLDGEEVRRSYSICTGVNDGELRVAVKRVPGALLGLRQRRAERRRCARGHAASRQLQHRPRP